ncbi:MAG: ParA family protein [Caldilineaceae bacterium SB0665_bin_25]|nr:ParA family protein [Caldilineaceae bacterium SB0665_bin_25]
MKTIAFFNNKGGVGKTSLVYHLAWMYADLGLSVVAADFDPQANLTSMFLNESELELLWDGGHQGRTVYGAFRPLLAGTGDIAPPHTVEVSPGLALLAGDLALSRAEDDLSSEWPGCMDGKERSFRVISALWRLAELASQKNEAKVVLIDVGPNLGALNRAALVASENVVIPLAPDLFSMQGLRNLGPTLRDWRNEWQDRLGRANGIQDSLHLPPASMNPTGYVVLQHAVRLDRPVKAYGKWMQRIPNEYRSAILQDEQEFEGALTEDDPHCLKNLKHYRSLMPLAQEARKPIFFLRAADGAIGGHLQSVQDSYDDFRSLAWRIADGVGMSLPFEY